MDTRRRLGAYRALLRLFPRGAREEQAVHLESVFLAMCAEWDRFRGGTGPVFWVLLGWDTLRAASQEWLHLLRRAASATADRPLGEHMSSFFGDLRYALRQLMRQPLHGLTVVLLMAVGVAGNAAVFRVFDGLFLKPLPFQHPEQLVDMDETAPQWDLEHVGIAYPDFAKWREDSKSFTGMAVYNTGGANFSDGTSATRVSYVNASYDLGDVLGIHPALGRFFTRGEDSPDAPWVALLTRPFWERQFGADPGIVGRTVVLNDERVQIVGVLPPAADLVQEADLWIPLRESVDGGNGWYLTGMGRLKPGVTLAQGHDDLMAIHKGMAKERSVNQITSPILASLRDRYLGKYRLGSGFLLGAVAAVLLIACANITGLMFARALAREPDIGVRLALGASRGRIVRQLLTESGILAGAGAVAGGALGVCGSSLLVRRMSDQFPKWVSFDLDARFLAFTLGVTVAAAVFFGLAPALRAAGRPARMLGGAGRATGSAARRRALAALVTGEVAPRTPSAGG
jgi:putative ABC transport system permease protein